VPLINTATNLYLGGTRVKAAYRNGVLVWPPGSGNRVNASLALKFGSTVTLTVSWAGDTPTSWKAWVSINGGTWQYWTEKTVSGSYDYATTYSTRVKMKVEAYYSGFAPDIAVYTGEVAIGAAPPPPTVQKFVELEAVSSGSYNGSNGNRNSAECYYGYVSSVHGQQQSLWCWNIPSDVRNCIRIDRIDVRVYNIHAYQNAGGSTGLVVHHGAFQGGFPASFPGRTGILQYGGNNWLIGTPKPGYMSQDGSGWMTNIHVLTAPGRTTLAEEFRVNGAQGMGLASPSSSTAHYGYAAGATAPSGQRPAIKIWYTVYT
jgi:hypothetical protein